VSKTSRFSLDGVDVFAFGYDQDVDERVLSADERRTADRFATDVLRARYVVQHVILRELLAQYVGTPIELRRGARGKPFTDGIEFNLSHCDDLALVAIAPFPVGVDVEHHGRVDPRRLARLVLAPAEAHCTDERAFLRVWCRKEAYLKATGAGLIDDLTSVSVLDDAIGDIAIRDLTVDDAHCAALAYLTPTRHTRSLSCPPETPSATR